MSTARTSRWAVPFAQKATVASGQRDGEGPAVFEAQHERPSNEGHVRDFVVCRSLNPMKSRDRHAGADQDALIAGDRVAHATQDRPVQHQVAGSRRLFRQFEFRVLHSFILLTKQ